MKTGFSTLAITASAMIMICGPVGAAEISSAYTKIDSGEDCTVYASAGEDDGDWANLVCNGYRGYPVMIQYGDLRESLHYGFPPSGDIAPDWESFGGFNSTSDTIEWRLADSGKGPVPFATIHRWMVSNAETDGETQVLVVEKVAQPGSAQGCVVGYVVATGNPNANAQARDVADGFATEFGCGIDEPVIRQGSVALPHVYRSTR